MAILGQILARLGHFWALPKIFRNVSDHHRFQHKKYCGFGKFELLRRQSRHFFKIHYTIRRKGSRRKKKNKAGVDEEEEEEKEKEKEKEKEEDEEERSQLLRLMILMMISMISKFR